MIVDAVRVACGSDGVMVEDEDPLRPPPFSPPPDSGHNPSEANSAAGEARLHAELQSTLIEQQDQRHCAEKGVDSEAKVRAALVLLGRDRSWWLLSREAILGRTLYRDPLEVA